MLIFEQSHLGGKDHECNHSDVRASGLQQMVQSCQGFDEDIRSLVSELVSRKLQFVMRAYLSVTVEAPASSEEIECAVQVEVEVAVEVTAYELVDLLLAGGVQILKNI